MTFTELVVQNFGVFLGEHRMDLSVSDSKRPVILVGGKNGAGKTTILDAIQLALYGQRASLSKRSGAYPRYLSEAVHRDAPEDETSAVELAFVVVRDGVRLAYRVRREWSVRRRAAKETLTVTVDGCVDSVLGQQWDDHVEEILPLGVSRLFLFDGEQIKEFADPDAAADSLRTGVRVLLGLEQIEQLDVDLGVLRRRLQLELADAEIQAQHQEGSRRLQALVSERESLALHAAECRSRVDLIAKELKRAERSLARAGGDLFEQRVALEKRLATLQAQASSLREEGCVLAAEALPLTLLAEATSSLVVQHENEELSDFSRATTALLEGRDQALLDFLKRLGAGGDVLDAADGHLRDDRASRSVAGVEPFLQLDPDCAAQVRSLEHTLLRQLERAAEIVRGLDEVGEAIAACERQLEGVPAIEAIRDLIGKRATLRQRHDAATGELETLEEERRVVSGQCERLRDELERLMLRAVDHSFVEEDTTRMIVRSGAVQAVLARFRTAVVAKNIARVESEVLACFRKLIRKERLVESVRIDPDDFRLNLFAVGGGTLTVEQLSAGERQLLAVAMLWGLARCSNRLLPTIIDTPLGRLDSEHRSRVVDSYLPAAGHQVLVLSTDREIDDELFARLRSHVSRTYTLVHRGGASALELGYFHEAAE